MDMNGVTERTPGGVDVKYRIEPISEADKVVPTIRGKWGTHSREGTDRAKGFRVWIVDVQMPQGRPNGLNHLREVVSEGCRLDMILVYSQWRQYCGDVEKICKNARYVVKGKDKSHTLRELFDCILENISKRLAKK